MKKQHYFLIISAFVALVVMPAIIKAQVDETESKMPLRTIPAQIRQEIRSNIQERQDNARTNQNFRNYLLQSRASSTRMMYGSSTRTWNGTSTQSWNGTSTRPWSGSTTPSMMRERMNRNASTTYATSTGTLRRSMRTDAFEIKKNSVVVELQKALDNLKNIRGRIQTRIDKSVASGTDMTAANALLVTADMKISAAQSAIDSIGNMITATTSPMVDVNRPRLAAGGAQKAIKDAQKALNDVVIELIKIK